jgi:hypothetical protein
MNKVLLFKGKKCKKSRWVSQFQKRNYSHGLSSEGYDKLGSPLYHCHHDWLALSIKNKKSKTFNKTIIKTDLSLPILVPLIFFNLKFKTKTTRFHQAQWLTLIIQTTWEVEISSSKKLVRQQLIKQADGPSYAGGLK